MWDGRIRDPERTSGRSGGNRYDARMVSQDVSDARPRPLPVTRAHVDPCRHRSGTRTDPARPAPRGRRAPVHG